MIKQNQDLELEDLCPDCRGLLVLKEEAKIASGDKLRDFAKIYICEKCKSRWIRHHGRNHIIRY
jgi:uncharacterized protein with PIN domain